MNGVLGMEQARPDCVPPADEELRHLLGVLPGVEDSFTSPVTFCG